MNFRQELRTLIDRHITPSSGYGVYYEVQIALQQEMIRLDLEADRFSDEEMDVGLEELPDGMPALIDLDPRDLPSRDILRAQFAGDLTGSVHPDARDDT